MGKGSTPDERLARLRARVLRQDRPTVVISHVEASAAKELVQQGILIHIDGLMYRKTGR